MDQLSLRKAANIKEEGRRMQDVTAHFLVMVGEACESARLASLPVEVATRDGQRLTGVPIAEEASMSQDEVDDTGYRNELIIDGVSIELEEVVELQLHRPAGG